MIGVGTGVPNDLLSPSTTKAAQSDFQNHVQHNVSSIVRLCSDKSEWRRLAWARHFVECAVCGLKELAEMIEDRICPEGFDIDAVIVAIAHADDWNVGGLGCFDISV